MDRASVYGTDTANPQPSENTKTCDDCPRGACQSLCHPCAKTDPQADPKDADLAAVVAAWPALPDALKAGILAMVKTADPAGGKRGDR